MGEKANKDQQQSQSKGQNQNGARTGAYRPTVKDMQNDSIAVLAEAWSSQDIAKDLDAQVIERVYHDELVKNNFSITKLTLLEVSQYLEKVRNDCL